MFKWCILFLFLFAVSVNAGEEVSIPWKRDGFDPAILLKKEAYLPEHFSINYLFSMGIIGFSDGTSRSGGTYLSLLRYDISPSLTLSAAIGFSMLFHSTLQEKHPKPFQEETLKPRLSIPFVALDYQISENANLRVQISDGSDEYDYYRNYRRIPYTHKPKF